MVSLPAPFAVGRTAEIYVWQDGKILKLYRDWCPSNWVDHEAHIAAIVTAAGVPAPKAYEVVEVNGRRGLVYERLDGISMLQHMRTQPLKLAAYGRTLADLHLEMHSHSVPVEIPNQKAQLEGSIRMAKQLPEDVRQAALAALAGMPEGDRLCHGDYHPDNVLMTSQGLKVIDWMTANRGDPWADVARTHLLLSFGQPTGNPLSFLLFTIGRTAFYNGYMNRYRAVCPQGAERLKAWIPIMAAARLNEEIPNEMERLQALARTLLD